jgi:hypothetical protein
MAQLGFGPIYCETMTWAGTSFPAEPVNTVSNGAIVLFGLAAAYMVAKRAPKSVDLYVLSGLLTATGVGSGLWHGLREPWALAFDVTPGLLFLFALIFCWARRLWSYAGAAIFLLAFYLLFQYSREYWGLVQRWVALAPVVIVAAGALIAQTYVYSKRAALGGVVALSSALAALFFRTIDLDACAYVPFGSHFLWHILLSAAGFVGVLTLTRLPARSPKAAAPAAEAAE